MIAVFALAGRAGTEKKRNMTADFIDAHVHVWSGPAGPYAREPGYSGPAYKPAVFTPETLLEHARPCGVSRVVLVQMSFYGFDNSYMLDAIRRYPDVFRGIAVVDDSHPKPQDEMLLLAHQGVRGFRIILESDPRTRLATPGMEAMWRCASESRLVLGLLAGPDALPSIDAMCTRFPEAPVVIDHMGRVGSDGQIRDADVRALSNLARHPEVCVKISAFYALGRTQAPYDDLAPLIRTLYEAYGPKRLMWASDSPFQVQPPHTYRGSVDLIRNRLAFLPDENREWLLRKTAERIFFGTRTGARAANIGGPSSPKRSARTHVLLQR
jgi:predicted TIM-barrel fold metal-dependent hydrolase